MRTPGRAPKRGGSGWLLAAIACALLAAAPGAAPQTHKKPATRTSRAQQEKQQALASAQLALDGKKYSLAATILENFLFDHLGDPEALFQLAYTYSLDGRTADAIDTYRQTLEVAPKLVPARLNLGLLLLNSKKPAEGVEELQQALELDPNHYRARFYTAVALEELGRTDEALEHYRRAALLDPKQVGPRRAALRLLLQKENLAEAEKVLEEWLALEPNQPELLRLRGDFRLRQEKTEQAVAAYKQYLKAAPDDAALHVLVGQLVREQGQFEEALRHFRAAEQAAADTDEAAAAGVREQALTLAALERWEEAIPLCRRALERDPDNVELHATLGFALLKSRQYKPAIPALVAALRLEPKRVETLNHLASALYLSENYAGTIQVLDQRGTLAGENTSSLFLRAISYDKLNQCLQAITYYEKFLAVNRDTNTDPYFQATSRLRLLKKVCRQKRRR